MLVALGRRRDTDTVLMLPVLVSSMVDSPVG